MYDLKLLITWVCCKQYVRQKYSLDYQVHVLVVLHVHAFTIKN